MEQHELPPPPDDLSQARIWRESRRAADQQFHEAWDRLAEKGNPEEFQELIALTGEKSDPQALHRYFDENRERLSILGQNFLTATIASRESRAAERAMRQRQIESLTEDQPNVVREGAEIIDLDEFRQRKNRKR